MVLPATIGPYTVVRELGRGGMGVVYEVRHPRAPRSLALKQLLYEELDPTALDRFTREAMALARVKHPNVVGLLSYDRAPEGPYLVTELVEGTSLRSLAVPLEPRRAAEVVLALADGLEAVHAAGVLHRDLKPENAILRADGTPVLLDFGLARGQDARTLTADGSILGTPSYMAPEQLGASRELDVRADVYGLGGVLFFLLAGRPPFDGAQFEILAKVMRSEPVWPERVPAGLLAVLRRAMAKDREARTASAASLRDELGDWLAGKSPVGRRRPGVVLLVAVAVAAAVGVGLALPRARTPVVPAPTPPASEPPASEPPPPTPPAPVPTPTRAPVEPEPSPAIEGVGAYIEGGVATLTSVGLVPWERRTKLLPTGDQVDGPSRRDHIQTALTWDERRSVVWLFGGLERRPGSSAGRALGDLWSWDGDRWAEVAVPGGPPARYGHAVVHDPRRDVLIVFGGFLDHEDKTKFDDVVWELDLVARLWAQRRVPGPGPRMYAGVAWSGPRGAALLFGGTRDDSGRALDADLWAWDGRAWSPVSWTGSGPPPSNRVAMAQDPARDRLFVFGGKGKGEVHGDLWLLEAGRWSRCEPGEGCPPRLGHVLVHDGRRLLLFGGSSATAHDPRVPGGGFFADTWVHDGGGWRMLRTGLSPSPRASAGACWDPERGQVVLLGGVTYDGTKEGQAVEGSTWTFPLGLLP